MIDLTGNQKSEIGSKKSGEEPVGKIILMTLPLMMVLFAVMMAAM